ncbi:MAG: PorP/SprF family type IX secretion system membrane protein [Saprospiraceae bacterium]|nr:PorP/SprF family type IX secretion system membrane protein [Saprospiraceae bacterium]
MKRILFCLALLFITTLNYAQDNIFILQNQVPVFINPSLAGVQCMPMLRIQYQHIGGIGGSNISSFKGLSFDMPVKLKNGDKLGFGYRFSNDVSGQIKYSQTRNFLAFSYHKILGSETNPHIISIGAEAGIQATSLDLDSLRWPSQIPSTGTGWDPTISSGEDIDASKMTADFNAGLSWTGYLAKDIQVVSGFAIYHFNRPNISLTGNESRQNIRSAFHTQIDANILSKWHILPSFFYTKQGPQNFYMTGIQFGYEISNSTYVELGGVLAKNNQNFLTAQIRHKRISAGLSYSISNTNIYTRFETVIGIAFGDFKCK